MSERILTSRELNRATLARQMLLERQPLDPLTATERLAGLQAQSPRDPYVGLWSRLEDFDPEELSRHLAERAAVRAQLMRATIHLVTAADYPVFAATSRSVLERVFRPTPFAKATASLDVDEVAEAGRALLTKEPRSRAELADLLAERFPGIDPPSLAQMVTFLLPVVQVPPRGLWRQSGAARWALATNWLGIDHLPEPDPDALVLRYLAAFGPATTADARVWSNLTGLREVFERLRPRLVTYRDESGRELFDLPDAPLPPPDTPAPVRFLAEFDNLLLSHADRSRVMEDVGMADWQGSILVDGFVAGHWRHRQQKDRLEMAVSLAHPQPKAVRTEVEGEAERLATFLAKPDSSVDLTVSDPA